MNRFKKSTDNLTPVSFSKRMCTQTLWGMETCGSQAPGRAMLSSSLTRGALPRASGPSVAASARLWSPAGTEPPTGRRLSPAPGPRWPAPGPAPSPGPAPGPPCSKIRPPRSGPPGRAARPAARTVPRPAPAPPSPWPPRGGTLLASPTAARPGAARGPGSRRRRAGAHFCLLREDGQQLTPGSQPTGTLAPPPPPPHSPTGPPATLRRRSRARAGVLGAKATEGGPSD